MSMRMSPQVAQQNLLPDINRSSLVFFGGLALIIANLVASNGHVLWDQLAGKHPDPTNIQDLRDTGIQIVMLALLTLLAEYGGDGAGSAALLFILALWLLWLVTHFGSKATFPSGVAGGSLKK